MKPILFNTEMVRAIQNGTKTVTRRVLKPQPKKNETGVWIFKDCYWINGIIGLHSNKMDEYAPYKQNDILWVRETWRKDVNRYMYKADYSDNEKFYRGGEEVSIKWCPSIHMPKEAARIFLRVTNVRVEKLQDITPEQIDEEGCKEYGYSVETGKLMPSSPCYFSIVWNGTIRKSDRAIYGWDANPYVFVISFERISKNEALQ